jgi:hypothetical protein
LAWSSRLYRSTLRTLSGSSPRLVEGAARPYKVILRYHTLREENINCCSANLARLYVCGVELD